MNAPILAGLPETALLKYSASATEQEIMRDALNAPSGHDHVFDYLIII
jgi:hypothetical protein